MMEDADENDMILINRPGVSIRDIQVDSDPWLQPKKSIFEKSKNFFNKKFSRKDKTCGDLFKRFLLSFFPFITILSDYSLKEDLLKDLISGLTISVMHIPQGMAYGLLADLDAVHGLYISLFPTLVYFFFGTSRHISIGSFAIVSLMIAKTVQREAPIYYDAHHNVSSVMASSSNDTMAGVTAGPVVYPIELRLGIALTVSFIAAVMQLGAGLCRLGFLTIYLSDPLVRGYTTACAVHVVTSQIPTTLGLSFPSAAGAFNVIYNWITIFQKIPNTNLITLAVSAVAGAFLVFSKEIFEPKVWKKKIPFPFPSELLLVIISILISYLVDLNTKAGVKIVGAIPDGIPKPEIPRVLTYFTSDMLMDAFMLALISLVVAISMGKLFSRKHRYKLDANQEFMAIGLANFISSFFMCYTSSASLSRSLVQEGVGGKTQIAGIFSSCVLLLVILAAGAVLSPLPTAILAIIVIINLKGMFKQCRDVVTLYRLCVTDMLVWMVVFVSTVVFDIDYGLFIGIGFLLITVIFRSQSGKFPELLPSFGHDHTTDLWLAERSISATTPVHRTPPQKPCSSLGNVPTTPDTSAAPGCTTTPQFVVLRIDSPLYFATFESIVKRVHRRVIHRDDLHTGATGNHSNNVPTDANLSADINGSPDVELPDSMPTRGKQDVAKGDGCLDNVILDCSGMSFIDSVGLESLDLMCTDLGSKNIQLRLSQCTPKVLVSIARHASLSCKFFGTPPRSDLEDDAVTPCKIFPTIQDAVLSIEQQRRKDARSRTAVKKIEATSEDSILSPVYDDGTDSIVPQSAGASEALSHHHFLGDHHEETEALCTADSADDDDDDQLVS